MKNSRRWKFAKKNAGPLLVLAGGLILLPACGAEEAQDSDDILVEVVVESDGSTAADLEVDVNARENPESVVLDSVEVPYRETFAVSKNVFIPLTSTHVRAKAAGDASWISCTILYDEEVVATHKARGDHAEAACEKVFRLGPG
ncbi:hypothetical protein QWJ34_12370 [Saccharibacillus sp. CPCC 101409]|uniref:hypothetical protein n=1 Tax=Saccharibacillus sp. CPCC 101409 TaxID=3058041 RepID=UPI0026711FDB|nr:hypothetical protein [Saccharibacillus sp. CPCC 101409]MDO3410558.1 hypothetical protein [Saccharibacillus sp. CPCC 101409]